ncbi:hypothetical protein QYE76_052750 [Lolium multiflorum]|uniref:F-box domain-containing protein n=1 Tax=Lolium multiflorum TaxID=4521 RepID=A0AAD8SUH6_LOLMU|nr:hypothetical protein QYE76_052750 [Lolium multiflorum]
MSHRRSRPSSPSPELADPLEDDDLLHEILLHLPPQPPYLLRASLVSKRWRRLATDRKFLRRFHLHHRRPPLLGLLSCQEGKISFRSTLDPPYRIPPDRFSPPPPSGRQDWSLLDCRHGRLLFDDWKRRQLVVWDPITDDYRVVVEPPQFLESGFAVIYSGAVLCAAGELGHVHGDCHSSPFQVVLLATLRNAHVFTVATVYSSKTGMWSHLLSTPFSSFSIYRNNPPIESMQSKELFQSDTLHIYHPFTSFYTQGMESSLRRK